MPKYAIREGAVLPIKNADKLNPQKIGSAVDRASRALDTKLKAGEPIEPEDRVVDRLHDEAASLGQRHPLHPHLEWDDKKCGRIHRKEQIRAIIRVLVIVDEKTGEESKGHIYIKSADDRMGFYRPQAVIRNDPELQIQVLIWCEKEINRCVARLRDYGDLFADGKALLEKLRSRRQQIEADSSVSLGEAAD